MAVTEGDTDRLLGNLDHCTKSTAVQHDLVANLQLAKHLLDLLLLLLLRTDHEEIHQTEDWNENPQAAKATTLGTGGGCGGGCGLLGEGDKIGKERSQGIISEKE